MQSTLLQQEGLTKKLLSSPTVDCPQAQTSQAPSRQFDFAHLDSDNVLLPSSPFASTVFTFDLADYEHGDDMQGLFTPTDSPATLFRRLDCQLGAAGIEQDASSVQNSFFESQQQSSSVPTSMESPSRDGTFFVLRQPPRPCQPPSQLECFEHFDIEQIDLNDTQDDSGVSLMHNSFLRDDQTHMPTGQSNGIFAFDGGGASEMQRTCANGKAAVSASPFGAHRQLAPIQPNPSPRPDAVGLVASSTSRHSSSRVGFSASQQKSEMVGLAPRQSTPGTVPPSADLHDTASTQRPRRVGDTGKRIVRRNSAKPCNFSRSRTQVTRKGLPELARTILSQWYDSNANDDGRAYLEEKVKLRLAREAGIRPKQVATWVSNERNRNRKRKCLR